MGETVRVTFPSSKFNQTPTVLDIDRCQLSSVDDFEFLIVIVFLD